MKRQKLGQHYLIDSQVVRKIVDFAGIGPSERVLEIGTGRGALTRELVKLGASFIGYEIDEANCSATSEVVRGSGAEIVRVDAFAQNPEFDVLVTSLPYSESAEFVRWLSSREFSRAIAVLQRDFAEKIAAAPGERDYRGISAVAQIAFKVAVLAKVARGSFDPPPRVDSVVVSFTPRKRIPAEEVANVIRLFSLRRRQVDSALAELGMNRKRSYGRRRVYSLTPEEVHEICRPRARQ
ncbi:MAG TPA: rRNA adenine N-6-methyltransferase family protein [Nitrososphaerales archaeon]|nr:rRNA adenine N-6-methyltransferase family protein [Nitrososphaerales archaeon]